jgi:uncharacterized protein YecA (UPF0149 family)
LKATLNPAQNQPQPRPTFLGAGNAGEEVGRNDPCPCGAINPENGQPYKWKKCGMINAPHHKV